nr:hypothetical protein GCM10020092_081020 [Actinoplanes digitatis]
MNNRAIPEHTGRVVGGGSSINATIWARPFKADLDHWAAETGDSRWGYRHSLKIFKVAEDWQGNTKSRLPGYGRPGLGAAQPPIRCPWRPPRSTAFGRWVCPSSTISTASGS